MYSGSYKNTSSKRVKKTISINVRYYSAYYKMKASYSGGVAIDILVTKGAVTASLATGYTLSKLLSDIISNYGSTDIRSPGIENWGYRFKYVTNSSKDGFDIYLLTYNSKGRLADTKKIKSERYKAILI